MGTPLKAACSIAAVTLLASFLVAQQSRILHPEMKPEKGTDQEPAARLGQKTAPAWSATTIAAGVNKQPQPGHVVTRTGEIVDFSCYLQLGKHGAAHRSCGQKCVQNNQPVGLLSRDGTLYMLMPEEHDPRRDGGIDLRPIAAEHMAQIVEVAGTETTHNGYRALYVSGLK